MTLPKPQKAPEVDLEAIIAKQVADEHEWSRRATAVQAQAAHAFARLLEIAENSDTGQARRVSRFIAGTFNGRAYPFDLYDLRGLDVAIGDDMLVCLDALRWAKADLFNLVPNGETRVKGVIKSWDIKSAIT